MNERLDALLMVKTMHLFLVLASIYLSFAFPPQYGNIDFFVHWTVITLYLPLAIAAAIGYRWALIGAFFLACLYFVPAIVFLVLLLHGELQSSRPGPPLFFFLSLPFFLLMTIPSLIAIAGTIKERSKVCGNAA